MPKVIVETKFYTFDQNNSGGRFNHDAKTGIGYRVAVEATSEEDAISRAERIGLYFDGCSTGRDCSCCGDRWSSYCVPGTEEPEQYGEPLKGGWGIPSYVHYIDGRIESRDPA